MRASGLSHLSSCLGPIPVVITMTHVEYEGNASKTINPCEWVVTDPVNVMATSK